MKILKRLEPLKEVYLPAENYMSVVKDTCMLCGKEKICINVDSSAGEYYAGSVCPDCVTKECKEAKERE